MNRKYLPIMAGLVVASVLLPAFACTANPADEARDITLQIQKAAQLELDSLDLDTASVASQLAKTGLSGQDARLVLTQLLGKHNYIVDVAATDPAGVMVTLAPDSYSKFEGTDVSKQDVSIEYNRTRKPMLSKVFKAVEGFSAVILVWPIVSARNENLGSTSVLFKSEAFFTGIVDPIVKGKDLEIMVMQQDGLSLYDTDKSQIGRNLFTDPMYQTYSDLQALGKQVAASNSGTGSYSFPPAGGGQAVKKHVYWVSIGLHDTSWRLISSRKE